MNEPTDTTTAAQLRAFASRIESSPSDRAAVAGGFRAIAQAMEKKPDEHTRQALIRWLETGEAEKIAPEDNPETGAEPGPDLVDTASGPGLEVV